MAIMKKRKRDLSIAGMYIQSRKHLSTNNQSKCQIYSVPISVSLLLSGVLIKHLTGVSFDFSLSLLLVVLDL